MVPKKPYAPENKQRKESEGSKSSSRAEPLFQIRMDKAINWERAFGFNRKMVENTNREREAKK